MYISGPPGTGKTACLLEALKQSRKDNNQFQSVFVNCMNIRSSSDIYRCLWEKIDTKSKPGAKLNAVTFCNRLAARHSMIVICLDEVDQLCDRQSAVLYAAFRWPETANVILIGIANALDLVDKLLPKLKLTAELKPQLLHFQPYNKDEVLCILRHRLSETAEIISPSALELCARKVSAVTGDIRKALEICSLAIDRISAEEKEANRTPQVTCMALPGVRNTRNYGYKWAQVKQVVYTCVTINDPDSEAAEQLNHFNLL
ncbi:unnamed protein product [Soboliphyme baturini]|uniref:ATPase_AAA_core domain-containing protein n=1 Tax=Soboliphyme baturini TaxID=241478 RepID=A0A183IRP6_9BILA|nr:unnamed protein product [Soboliphyme baturini]